MTRPTGTPPKPPRSRGPRHVSVDGREEVVVVSAAGFRSLDSDLTGEALIAAMQACPDRDIDLAPARGKLPVRCVGFGLRTE